MITKYLTVGGKRGRMVTGQMLAVHMKVRRTDTSREEDRLFFIGNEAFLDELLKNAKLFWKQVNVVEILNEIKPEDDLKDYVDKAEGKFVCTD